MSPTWVRAQAFGQPFTLTVIGVSRSGKRRSSSATRSRARLLVSTIASLQNSRPVQAIVLRRHPEGRAARFWLPPPPRSKTPGRAEPLVLPPPRGGGAEAPVGGGRAGGGGTPAGRPRISTFFGTGAGGAPATPYSSIRSASWTRRV